MTRIEELSLSEVSEVFNGKTPARSDQRESGHPVLKIKDTDEFGRFRGSHESFVDQNFARAHAARCIKLGDTLILNAAHSATHVASKIYTAQPEVIGALATGEWLVVRPNKEMLDPAFLSHWVRSEVTHRELRNLVKGIHLYPKDVGRITIPLPPLPEQRRIAAILDQADALRAKRRAVLALLDEMAQAIFVEMFGSLDPSICHWPRFRIEELVTETRIGLVRAADEIGEQYPFRYLKMDSLDQSGNLNLAKSVRTHATPSEVAMYRLSEGDILFNTRNSRELVGKSSIFKGNELYLYNNNIMRLRFRSSLNSEYIAILFQNPAVKKSLESIKSGTTSVFAIYWRELKQVEIPVPPIEIQNKFGQKIRALRNLIEKIKLGLTELDSLFASLQHRAFRGEL